MIQKRKGECHVVDAEAVTDRTASDKKKRPSWSTKAGTKQPNKSVLFFSLCRELSFVVVFTTIYKKILIGLHQNKNDRYKFNVLSNISFITVGPQGHNADTSKNKIKRFLPTSLSALVFAVNQGIYVDQTKPIHLSLHDRARKTTRLLHARSNDAHDASNDFWDTFLHTLFPIKKSYSTLLMILFAVVPLSPSLT